jgi:putative inorganic carbon (HCO3(-)) transporter
MIAFGFVILPFLTAFLARRNLVFAAAFLLAILPAYQIRGGLFGIPTTALEIALLVFLAFVALAHVRTGRRPLWGEAQILLLFFLAVSAAAALISPDVREALGLWRAYFFEPVLYFLALINVVRSSRDIAVLFFGLGTSMIVIGLVSFWQALGLLSAPLPYAGEMPPRLSSLFPYPNAVALFVVPVVLLFMPFLLSSLAERRRSVFLVGGVLFGTFALFASVSESGFLGFFAGLAVLLLLLKRYRILLALIVLLVLVIALVPTAREHIAALATFSDTSTDVRLRLWEGTLNLLSARPIVGAGLAGFPAIYDLYRDPAHVELLLYPHSILLNFWVEIGLAGLLLILAFLFRFFQRLARPFSPRLEPYRVGLIAAMVGLLVHGLFDVPYFKNDLAILFWTFLACGVLLAGLERQNKNSPLEIR